MKTLMKNVHLESLFSYSNLILTRFQPFITVFFNYFLNFSEPGPNHLNPNLNLTRIIYYVVNKNIPGRKLFFERLGKVIKAAKVQSDKEMT